ncbi:hypothetical protein ACFVFI_26700 [Streptomyces sp. NPDC057705]|uniref:hypothetical protein n=1 Tax=Streptomyces sp. NPDC057705 TaxID=3346222 RepID=UPI00369CC6DC
MSSGLSYHADVTFMAECNPALVERNAAEFRRLRDLLVEVEEPARRAERTKWESDGSTTYFTRLTDARELVTHMAQGFDKAASALHAYALALETAKSHYRNGARSERALAALIGTKGIAVTKVAQRAEPMRQWEDMRATTGVFDFLAEVAMDVDDIRDEANRLHDAAGGGFHLAKTVEQEARDTCVHALKQAYELMPALRVQGGGERPDLYAAMADLRREGEEARNSPLAHLPGSGPKREMHGTVGEKTYISPELKDIRMRVAGLPQGEGMYWNPPDNDQEKAQWISRNKEILRAAAQHAGLPEELVAGIAWNEIAGQGGYVDDFTDHMRHTAAFPLSPITPENLPSRLGGVPDQTSFGPIAIQVRRGAEVLGYDPAHLTEAQRALVEESLQDHRQNAFIAAGFLAQIKSETPYADVPADQLTDAQMREIAARYNGGPYWETKKAQDYGDNFTDGLGQVKEAMR